MRVMAIDYGDAHTGVAISDPSGLLAGWTATVNARRQEDVLRELLAIIREHEVDELVLGFPKNMNDTQGPRAEKSRELARLLEEAAGMEVCLWDERLTTVDAHRILSANGRRGKQRKGKVDAVAASLILEGYLGCRKNRQKKEE